MKYKDFVKKVFAMFRSPHTADKECWELRQKLAPNWMTQKWDAKKMMALAAKMWKQRTKKK